MSGMRAKIEQDQIEPEGRLRQDLERPAAVLGRGELVLAGRERQPVHLPHERRVLDDQYLHAAPHVAG